MEQQKIEVKVEFGAKTSYKKSHPIRVEVGEAVKFNLSLAEVANLMKSLEAAANEFSGWRDKIDRLESVKCSAEEVAYKIDQFTSIDPKSKDFDTEENDLRMELDNLKDFIDDV